MIGSNGAVHGGLIPTDEGPATVIIQSDDDSVDRPQFDEKGALLTIEHADGAITLTLDGKPIEEAKAANAAEEWFDNLCSRIGDSELGRITDELLQGIDDDLQSRKEWIEDRALGLKLLGLKIELPSTQGGTDGAPVEGMSKVRHPLLLEAVVRFNANARSEFLPTDGPVKIRNDDTRPDLPEDQSANDLQQDMNHYLTVVATEYYPDTDRMLFMAGFGGDGFKKVYECPLRSRPVSESVDAEDLIVNQSATDIANASRLTHRIMMKPSTVKRLQIMDVYRDVSLSDPIAPTPDALQQEKKAQQGLKPDALRLPRDQDREIYECYCELDIAGFEHKHKGKISGLQIPYVVTIDVSSRQVLSVVRNFDKTEELPVAKKRFVKFPFVPGLGFYDIGLLHILGNTTNAITAAWRLMLDNGMFANFPGFIVSKSGTRQNTNVMRVAPGSGFQMDTQGGSIRDAAMALPYNTAQMPPLMDLVGDMAETGRRIGGTAEVQVGEGRADVPVGTVMAMIDQAIKVMNAVHKRMHAAQAEEFKLLKQVIRDNIDEFLAAMCRSCQSRKTPLDKAKFLQSLDNCNLVPQADPNTSSSGQRLMKVMALKQLQGQSPNLYDPIKVDTAALAAIGWPNPEEFFVPPAARAAPPPQLQQLQEQMKNDAAAAQAKITEANARADEATAKMKDQQAKELGLGHYAPKTEAAGVAPTAPETEPQESVLDIAKAQAIVKDANTRERDVALKESQARMEQQNRERDDAARVQDAALDVAKEVIMEPKDTAGAGTKAVKIIKQVDAGLKPE